MEITEDFIKEILKDNYPNDFQRIYDNNLL